MSEYFGRKNVACGSFDSKVTTATAQLPDRRIP